MTGTERPNGPELRSLATGRVTDRVVTEIRDYIENHGLQVGDKLPPERVFIEQLSVSRSSLREALRVLSTLGRIEVRHGDGMYVAGLPEDWHAASGALFDPTEEHALRNLVETRVGVELAAAIAVTLRGTDEDLQGLQKLLDKQERRLRADKNARWEPLAFEIAVVEVSGNTWLLEIELALREAWLSLSGDVRTNVGRHNEWLSEHRAILASMRSRNVFQVQRLVLAHLSLERFEQDLGEARARVIKNLK